MRLSLTGEVASLNCMFSRTDSELEKRNGSLENNIVEVAEKICVLHNALTGEVACQHASRSIVDLESVRTQSGSQIVPTKRELTPVDNNSEQELKSCSVDRPVECVEKVVGEHLDKLSNEFESRTLTQRIEKKEAELDVIRRTVKNQRLREGELKQSSESISLDNIEGSDNHHSPLKPLEQTESIADHMLSDLGSRNSGDRLAFIGKENVGSLSLDLSTAVSSQSPSCDYPRSTRISSASASITETSQASCGKTSVTGSRKVQRNQEIRTSASMSFPNSSVSHWHNRAGSANLVVEGYRERTHMVNGTASSTNDNGGRRLVNASPTRTPSRRGDHVPSSSFYRPRVSSPSKHCKLIPASPEYRGVRGSSRLKER